MMSTARFHRANSACPGSFPGSKRSRPRRRCFAWSSVSIACEFLADLLCVGISPAWDSSHDVLLSRKPAKFPFVNLLAAAVWAPEAPRSAQEFAAMSNERQAVWYEWAVAQELFRRRAIAGEAEPERLPFWQGAGHEIDFVRRGAAFIEVKRGRASALDFAWFAKTFPRDRLEVICATPFQTDRVRGLTLHDFLQGA